MEKFSLEDVPGLIRLRLNHLHKRGDVFEHLMSRKKSKYYIVGDISYGLVLGHINDSDKYSFRRFGVEESEGKILVGRLCSYNLKLKDVFEELPHDFRDYVIFNLDIFS
jgi:hypothetical protein